MNQPQTQNYTHQLQQLMQRVGVTSYRELSRQAGVSIWQVTQLRQGQVAHMRLEVLFKLSQVLQVSLTELLAKFLEADPAVAELASSSPANPSSPDLQLEYQRLQAQLEQQRQVLWQEFQQNSLQTLESWLLQWPTAAYAAQQNSQLPAVKLLPLLRPVEQLLQAWGVEAIAPIGAELAYDPHSHQLMEGTAQPGDWVKVRYMGYRHGEGLLFRAKVSPLNKQKEP